MSEKTEALVSVLEDQAEKQKAIALKKYRESIEHKGAYDAFRLMTDQILNHAATVEEEISASTEIRGEKAELLLREMKKLIRRLAAECDRNAKNQQRQQLLVEGQSDHAKTMADDFMKQAEAHRAFAKKRDGLAEQARSKAAKPKVSHKKPLRKKSKRSSASPGKG